MLAISVIPRSSKPDIDYYTFLLCRFSIYLFFVCLLFKEYPSATFGMIFGAIAGFLISAIPILGVVLGPIVTPLAIVFGLIIGVPQDIRDKALARKIAEANAVFSPLNA